jgi:apolipoprotein N-acyltransferase
MLQVRQAMLAYRAVESRSSLVRSVNTGISCFVRPTGEIYGAVKNARGESWTGKGFPERSVIAEVMRRKARGAAGGDVTNLVAEIRRLRADAGIEGYSVQQVDLDSRRTPYSRIGDLFAQICAGILGFTLFAAIFRAFVPLPSRRVATTG